MTYNSDDIKIIGKSYQTKDGKYKTKTFSTYSYWFDEDDCKLGSTAYDYLFFVGKEGIESAVKTLNSLIKKYEL